jgi:serine/threonine protein kinase
VLRCAKTLIHALLQVWLAQARGGECVAVKSTILPPGADRKQQECFQRALEEASFMKLLSHPNLVPLLDSVQEDHEDGHIALHVVLPFYAGGDLLDYLRKKRCLTENEARLFFTQICNAVNSMHNRGLIHRDLKLENFFLSSDARLVYVLAALVVLSTRCLSLMASSCDAGVFRAYFVAACVSFVPNGFVLQVRW